MMPAIHDPLRLDPVIHGQLRLTILTLLAGVGQADFTWLRERTGATDGNLGANLAKLEAARYVAVTKRFIGRKPNSRYRLTASGRKALDVYIRALNLLLLNVRQKQA